MRAKAQNWISIQMAPSGTSLRQWEPFPGSKGRVHSHLHTAEASKGWLAQCGRPAAYWKQWTNLGGSSDLGGSQIRLAGKSWWLSPTQCSCLPPSKQQPTNPYVMARFLLYDKHDGKKNPEPNASFAKRATADSCKSEGSITQG